MAEQFFGATDTGRQRSNNEDAFFIAPLRNGHSVAACVIDGVGGYEGGEVAAALAANTIRKKIEEGGAAPVEAMRQGFKEANAAILAEKAQSGRNQQMACVLTMAVADAKNNVFYYAHVGDTRLYLLRDENLVKITRDQSFVGYLEDSGRLTEAAAMAHPKRNEINKALGFGDVPHLADADIETGESPFLPGDLLLLCSDGLTDLVPAAGMKSILLQSGSLEQKTTALIAAANNAGGKDNITVVLVQNTKKPLKQKAKMPVTKRAAQSEAAPIVAGPDPVVAAPHKPQKPPRARPLSKERRNQTAVIALSALCVVLLGGLSFLIWKQYRGPLGQEKPVVARNAAEQNLQLAINNAGDSLVLSAAAFGSSISLTDTIFINQDSLYLRGNTEFVSDSAAGRTAPAFYIGPNCRWIVLDGFTWKDFPVAIVAANSNALELKNASFVNCGLTLAYAGNGADFFHGTFVNTRTQKDTMALKPNRR